MSDLKFELLYSMFAGLDAPIDVGAGPEGHRMVVMVNGGHFEGPKVRGKVLPGTGGDWLRIRADGSIALDVRASLITDDGANIYTHYNGRATFESPEQMAKVMDYMTDDPVDASQYYFRTNPLYETSHPDYAWMNNIIAVGVGKLGNGGVSYDVYAIK